MSTTSLFDTILSEATAVASAPVVETTLPDFRPFSDRTEATPGFVDTLAVMPAVKEPHGYQWAAVETCLTFGKAIVGFEPGMGKTLVAQTVAANLVHEGRKVLVVCPPSLSIDPWDREFALEFPHLNVVHVEGRKPGRIDPDADVAIIGDAVLASRTEDIIEWGANVFIADEAHRFKSTEARRARALQELTDSAHDANRVAPEAHPAPVVVLLTGTLAMNRPDEVYQPSRITGRATVKSLSVADSYDAFARKWCVREERHTPNGVKFKTVGCVDPEALHEALRATVYLRTRREDVLDMPPKVWAVRGATLDSSELRTYNRIEKEFLAWVAEMMGDAAAARAAKGEAIVKLQKLWEHAAIAKAVVAAEHVADLVAQGEQVVVMAHHRAAVAAFRDSLRKHKVQDGFKQRGIRSVELVGGMTKHQKVEALDIFKSGRVEVLVGNIEAAGVGYNIDNAAHLVFIQLPWSPGNMVQASDRIYRQTSTRTCTIHVINALGTVDERMYGQLQAKASVTDRLNAGETGIAMPTDISVEGAVLESYGFYTD